MRRWLRRGRRRLGFELLRVSAWCASLLGGLPLVRRCGERLGELHYHLARRKRRSLQQQLGTLFPHIGEVVLLTLLRDAFRTSDRAVFEFIAMGCRRLPEEQIRAGCEIEGMARLHAALAAGRGVILLGMHMGNAVLMAARLAAEGLPVSLVTRESRKVPQGFLQRGIARHGIKAISAGSRTQAYRDMLRALQRGGIVYVLMDQATKHDGISVEFLGKPVELPAGPPRLAQRSGAPVLPAFLQAAQPSWRFDVGEPIDLGSGGLEEATTILARVMESHILAHPDLWTWHHRRWRRYPFANTATESR